MLDLIVVYLDIFILMKCNGRKVLMEKYFFLLMIGRENIVWVVEINIFYFYKMLNLMISNIIELLCLMFL